MFCSTKTRREGKTSSKAEKNILTLLFEVCNLETLERNILTECDFYKADLLIAVSGLPTEFWNENQSEFLNYKKLVERNSELIKNELGKKKFDQISEKTKTNWQHVKK